MLERRQDAIRMMQSEINEFKPINYNKTTLKLV